MVYGGRGATSYPRGSQVAPTNVYDRSDRPIREYGRGDHLLSSEISVEIQVAKLEPKRPPRLILKLIGPICFSAVRVAGGRGVTDFFGGRGHLPGFFPESSITLPDNF